MADATWLNRSEIVGRGSWLSKEALSGGLVVAAIFFNAFLAVVNAHFVELSKRDVSAFEAGISALALMVVATNFRSSMLPWLVLLTLDLMLHSVLVIANQAFNPIFIRDAIDIPIFIALGMVYARGNIVRLFFYIQLIVLLVLGIEFLFESTYAHLFDVLRYYVNTRNYEVHTFWNKGSTLFVSATRPGERFLLSSLGLHRGSSVFLEPVSLGNFSILAAAFTVAFWDDMARWMRCFFAVSTLLILIGSDGRLATVTCGLLIIGKFLFPRMPRYSNIMYLPGVLILAGIIVVMFGLQASGDNFTGRLAGSIDFLANLDIAALFGLDPGRSGLGFDSGISYFLITQSLIGLTAWWLFICVIPQYQDRRSTIFIHSICTYITLNLLVSYSLFSIKTAAPMWFIYGYLLTTTETASPIARYSSRRCWPLVEIKG
jgi:putative polymerase